MSIEQVQAALNELGIEENFTNEELKILADRGFDSKRTLLSSTRQQLDGLRAGRVNVILECQATRQTLPGFPGAVRPSPAAGAISALPFSFDYSEGFSYGRLLAESRMRHEENEKKDRQAAAAAAKLAKNQAAAAANLSKNQAAKTKHLREEGFTALSALEDLQTPLLRGN